VAAAAVAKVADPRIPLGWLGDIVLVAARPVAVPVSDDAASDDAASDEAAPAPA
jgi:hypothetical protein